MLRSATSFIALPCAEKICAFAISRSLRSMPGPRGRAPTSSAALQSLNATRGSSVATILFSVGNAQSLSSMTTPASCGSAGVTSSRCRFTGVSGPSIWPEATRKARAYPIWPAAPVMATLTAGFIEASSRAQDGHKAGRKKGPGFYQETLSVGCACIRTVLAVEFGLLGVGFLGLARGSQALDFRQPGGLV